VYENFDFLTMREDTSMSRTAANRKENERKRNNVQVSDYIVWTETAKNEERVYKEIGSGRWDR